MNVLGYHPVDDIIQRYVKCVENLFALRSRDPVDGSAERCRYCGGTKRTDGEVGPFCVGCGQPWKGVNVILLKSDYDSTPKVGAAEQSFLGQVDTLRRVRPLVETPPGYLSEEKWLRWIQVYIVWLDPDVDTLYAVARWASVFRGWSMSQHYIENSIRETRQVISRRLRNGMSRRRDELLNARQGAEVLGLRNGTGWILSMMKRGAIPCVVNLGTEKAPRYFAPRWVFEEMAPPKRWTHGQVKQKPEFAERDRKERQKEAHREAERLAKHFTRERERKRGRRAPEAPSAPQRTGVWKASRDDS